MRKELSTEISKFLVLSYEKSMIRAFIAKLNFIIHMQRHAFYPRRGRQRCLLRHVMALYNVHLLFTICVKSPINE
uniref:SFRICE_027595 n=1 Tax=Spodoptera frugiperda TaxID=7108 RepID=A0A2H1VDG1_SPOFR